MLLRFILTFVFLSLLACSEADMGTNFSENFKEQAGKNNKVSVSTNCPFAEVNYTPTDEVYGDNTVAIMDELLQKYVTPLQPKDSFSLSGQVNYNSWISSFDDKKNLCVVVNHINNTDPDSFDRNQKMSFYINAYNMLTIELILKNLLELDKGVNRDTTEFPLQKSIRNIGGLDSQVWDVFKWKVGTKNLSLNQIEKEILIPMGDARIHFAVNCASKGCPPLRNEAFTADKLDAQLDEMSTFFVTSPAYNSIELLDDVYDPENGDNFYEVSSIFDWYAEDFENDISGRYGSFQEFIVYHLDRTDEELGFPKADLTNLDIWLEEYSDYDWSLNEVI